MRDLKFGRLPIGRASAVVKLMKAGMWWALTGDG